MSERADYRLYAAATAAFTVLVISMWAWYGLHSGMGYETHFPLHSESTDRGWHFGMDMRRFTSMFYHLAYLISSWAGHAGSYVPYQIVYAVLWVLRGLLVFQIVRMLGDRRGGAALLAGAFTIVHGADTSLNWVGQLNQAGFIFWMLLAFVVLLMALELQNRLLIAIPLAVLATQFARICIYSYESPLPLIFGFPLLALSLFLGWSWRKALLLGVFYSLPLQYCWRWLSIYLNRNSEASYQFSVLRQDWGIGSILSDWALNVWHSLAFWQWPRVSSTVDSSLSLVITAWSLIACGTLLAAFLWTRRTRRNTSEHDGSGLELRLMSLGLAMVVLSFPAYLLLETATSSWRTQLLSGAGAGIAWSSALTLLSRRSWRRERAGGATASLITVAIVVAGVWAGQVSALKHRLQWEQHRTIVASMLAIAPRIPDGTLLLLVNRQPGPLVFGENVWWDYAVRLAYPNRKVSGVYFDAPGKTAPGARLRMSGTTVQLHADIDLAFSTATLSRALVFEWLPGDKLAVAPDLPEWLTVEPRARTDYRPRALIGPWPPDERAVRRFGPIARE